MGAVAATSGRGSGGWLCAARRLDSSPAFAHRVSPATCSPGQRGQFLKGEAIDFLRSVADESNALLLEHLPRVVVLVGIGPTEAIRDRTANLQNAPGVLARWTVADVAPDRPGMAAHGSSQIAIRRPAAFRQATQKVMQSADVERSRLALVFDVREASAEVVLDDLAFRARPLVDDR